MRKRKMSVNKKLGEKNRTQRISMESGKGRERERDREPLIWYASLLKHSEQSQERLRVDGLSFYLYLSILFILVFAVFFAFCLIFFVAFFIFLVFLCFIFIISSFRSLYLSFPFEAFLFYLLRFVSHVC